MATHTPTRRGCSVRNYTRFTPEKTPQLFTCGPFGSSPHTHTIFCTFIPSRAHPILIFIPTGLDDARRGSGGAVGVAAFLGAAAANPVVYDGTRRIFAHLCAIAAGPRG